MQAQNRRIMTMSDWIHELGAFLRFNEKETLTTAGTFSAEIAKTFAETEFEQYREIQDKLLESDFDKEIEKIGLKDVSGGIE